MWISCEVYTLCIDRCFKSNLYDGNQVYMIKRAGGIIFTKTNNPQMGFSFETNNFVFGRANNAYNPLYIAGGSTGVFYIYHQTTG